MPHTFYYLNGTSLFKKEKKPNLTLQKPYSSHAQKNLTARHGHFLSNTAKLCAFSSERRLRPLLLKNIF